MFKIKRIFYTLSILTMFLSAYLILQVAYWLLHDYKLIVFKEGHGKIVTPVVHGGEYVAFEVNRCKYDNLVHRVNTQFVDGIVYWTPEIITSCDPGCRKGIEKVYVPKTLSAGVYYLRRTITIKVNPIRTITLAYQTGTFEIVERSD